VWAGISKRGPTPVVIFEGIMAAEFYISILRTSLLPFIRSTYPDSHRFMHPKHTSATARFFSEEGINWWKTPPGSPDANAIENLWHELKEYVQREIKPSTKVELALKTFEKLLV
jgi:hypothetical protein